MPYWRRTLQEVQLPLRKPASRVFRVYTLSAAKLLSHTRILVLPAVACRVRCSRTYPAFSHTTFASNECGLCGMPASSSSLKHDGLHPRSEQTVRVSGSNFPVHIVVFRRKQHFPFCFADLFRSLHESHNPPNPSRSPGRLLLQDRYWSR